MNNIIFFKTLDSVIKKNLAEKMELVRFKRGEKIISIDEENPDKMYLLKRGSVSCKLNEHEITILNQPAYFGFIALLFKNRTLDVYSNEFTECFELTKEDLMECIGENYLELILLSIFQTIITNNQYLNDLIPEDKIESFFKLFKLFYYIQNEGINERIKERKLNLKRLIIIIEGNFIDNNTSEIIYSKENYWRREFKKFN